MELVQLRRETKAEDLCPRQRQEPDAGSLAGHGAEPPCGSQIARAAFPRAFLHALARQGRHRKQCQAFAVPCRQERIQLLQGLVGKRVLQPGDFRQHQPDGGD